MTKAKRKTQSREQALAYRIAKELFTDCQGIVADRLAMMDVKGRHLGGWGFQPAVDQIVRVLKTEREFKQ